MLLPLTTSIWYVSGRMELPCSICWQIHSKYLTEMCFAKDWYGVMCSLFLLFSFHISFSGTCTFAVIATQVLHQQLWKKLSSSFISGISVPLTFYGPFDLHSYFHLVKQNKQKRRVKVQLVGKLRAADSQLSWGSVTGVFTEIQSDGCLGKCLF